MDNNTALTERQKYINAFNNTMIKIWKEQITKLGVIRSGALYNSVVALGMTADAKYTSVQLSQSFLEYGFYVDAGTGSNTPIGNPGDIGRDNRRRRKRWFSKKHYASVMNLREFYAENLGKNAALVVSDALSSAVRRKFGSNRSSSVF